MASLKQDNPAMSSDRRQMLRRENNRVAESKPPRRLSDLPPNSPLSYVEGDLQYRRASEGIAGPEEWESSVGDRKKFTPGPARPCKVWNITNPKKLPQRITRFSGFMPAPILVNGPNSAG